MPYFQIPDRHLEAFKAYCKIFVEKTSQEPKCLAYGFSFNGNQAHCRECYSDAEGVLAHLDNVADLNMKAMHLASIARYEVHGPQEELDKLRGPLTFLNPVFYIVEYSYRKVAAA
jgi:quinol monooxygenase YgiN